MQDDVFKVLIISLPTINIGFVLCVDEKDVDAVIKELNKLGEKAYEIGVVTAGGEGVCLK